MSNVDFGAIERDRLIWEEEEKAKAMIYNEIFKNMTKDMFCSSLYFGKEERQDFVNGMYPMGRFVE